MFCKTEEALSFCHTHTVHHACRDISRLSFEVLRGKRITTVVMINQARMSTKHASKTSLHNTSQHLQMLLLDRPCLKERNMTKAGTTKSQICLSSWLAFLRVVSLSSSLRYLAVRSYLHSFKLRCSKCTECGLALQLSTDMARRMVDPDCDDPAPDADMEDEDWDYAYPGCEMDEDWNGAMAPQPTPPDAATAAVPAGKAL